jgi:hypothetical protein
MTVVFFALAAVMGPVGSFGDSELEGTLKRAAMVLPAFSLMPMLLVHKQMAARMKVAPDAAGRMAIFRARMIVLSAMAEGPCLFASVIMLLAGAGWFVIPAAVVQLAVAGAVAPTASRLAEVENPNHRGEP